MDAMEFIDFADSLIVEYDSEAAFRSAISRGYYGMIIEIKNHIQNIIENKKIKAGIHQYIPACLRYVGNPAQASMEIPEATSLASLIEELRRERQEADYSMAKTFKKKHAELFLPKCRGAIGNFGRLMQSEHRELIETRMKKYSEMRPPS